MGSIAIGSQPKVVAKPTFPTEANTLEYAQSLDAKDHMRHFRDQFIIPSKANIKSKKVAKPGKTHDFINIIAYH
jgi:kynureninase